MKLYEQYLQEIDPIIAGVFLTTMGVAAGLNTYLGISKSNPDKERIYIKNKCKKFQGKELKKCKYSVLLQMRKKFLSEIPKYKAKCKTQKDPQKCINYLNKKEKKLKLIIRAMEAKLRSM